MKLTFTNSRAESLSFDSDFAPLVLLELDGLGGVDAEMQTAQTPLQDGVTWLNSTAPARSISVMGAIVGDDRVRLTLRSRITRVMSAKVGAGRLKIEAYGRTREIDALVETGAAFVESEGGGIRWQEFTLAFFCPSPLFVDNAQNEYQMVSKAGGLTFPIRLPTRFTTINLTGRYLINNAGDVPCPLEIEFSGGAINPRILNADTGEFVRVNSTVPATSTLVIRTDFGGKRAYLVDGSTGAITDAMGYIDLQSTFFSLDVGANYLSFDAAQGADTANVTIRWCNRYAAF